MGTGTDSLKTRGTLEVGSLRYALHRLDALGDRVTRLPFSLRILLENLLRREDGRSVTREHIEARARLGPEEAAAARDPLHAGARDPAGLHRRPRVVDLAAMRDAMQRMGGDPKRINPLLPVDLVIDHSVQVDAFGTPQAFRPERRDRVRAQPRALRVPALGTAGVPRLPRRAARHRHRAPGEPRVPGAGRRAARQRTDRRWSFPTPWSAPTRTPP